MTLHQDTIEIEQLLYRYCHALDRGTVDEVIAAFHLDWWIMEWVVNVDERSYIYVVGHQTDWQTWASDAKTSGKP